MASFGLWFLLGMCDGDGDGDGEGWLCGMIWCGFGVVNGGEGFVKCC